jgi:hypothetical protein
VEILGTKALANMFMGSELCIHSLATTQYLGEQQLPLQLAHYMLMRFRAKLVVKAPSMFTRSRALLRVAVLMSYSQLMPPLQLPPGTVYLSP